MNTSPSPTCLIIGNGALADRCARALIDRQWSLASLYSSDASLSGFASEYGVPHLDDRADVVRFLSEARSTDSAGVDFIFSINNPWILPASVIQSARRYAINFHDSLLPQYGGLHATSWALIAGETEHGITWHVVDEGIDTGPILVQRPVSIEPSDTAFTLNAKAFETAYKAFLELADDLAKGTERPAVQPPRDEATYHGLRDRPESACTLSFEASVGDAFNLARALDFGHVHNPLGRPKVFLPSGRVAVVRSVDGGEAAAAAPGEVIATADDKVQVAFSDGTAWLTGFESLCGRSLTAETLAAEGVRAGARLPALSPAERAEVDAYDRSVARFESQWAPRLARANPVRHPFCAGADNAESVLAIPLNVADSSTETMVAGLAAYAFRVGDGGDFSLGWMVDDVPVAARRLFADELPLVFDELTDPVPTFAELRDRTRVVIAHARKAGGCALDVVGRHPSLMGPFPRHDIAVVERSSPGAMSIEPGAEGPAVVLACYGDGSKPELFVRRVRHSWHRRAIADHLEALLAVAVAAPETPLSRLPLMSDAQRARVVDTFNLTQTFLPGRSTLPELFRAQAERTPDSVAVRSGDDTLTFRALERRANQLARVLAQRGVQPGELVALCLPRSLEQIVAMLAVAKAGATFVPVDPTYPEDRIRYIIEDCRATLVVANRAIERSEVDAPWLCLDENRTVIANASDDEVPSAAKPDTAVYVIYTSGTTGNPKGVAIRHRSLVNHALAVAKRYPLTSDDRVLQSASFAFDVAAEQIWPVLFKGGQVVLRPPGLFESLARFDAFVRNEGITVLVLPTAFWNEWVSFLQASDLVAPPSLRAIGVGTEKALAGRLRAWRDRCSHPVRFLHGYGPTEATITCAMHVVDPHTPVHDDEEIPVGRPLDNTRLHVVDRFGEPLPVGLTGELEVAGEGLALAYHRRPELTQERFVARPSVGEARVYRTGDLVWRRPDGALMFVGRADGQVKINGYRVELGEVENALLGFSGVKEAVARVQPGVGARRLVAYYVADRGPLAEAALREHLVKTLPPYMVPVALAPLDQIPMTPNRKVDRRALPTLDEPSADGRLAPLDETERSLAAMVKTLLSVEQPPMDRSIFELGATSLVALRLAGQIQARFEVEVSLKTLFESPSIEEIAAFVRRQQSAEPLQPPAVSPLSDAPLVLADGEHRLTRGQEGLATLQHAHPESTAYNVHVGLRLTGRVRVNLLSECIRAIADHHEPLRSAFLLRPDGTWSVDIRDRSAVEPIIFEAGLRTVDEVLQALAGPFRLSEPPLLRAGIVPVTDNETVVVLVVHHLVFDGESLSVFCDELLARYERMVGEDRAAPELQSRFRDFVAWERQQAPCSESLVFWRSYLGGSLPAVDLPTDRPRPPVFGFEGAMKTWSLPADVGEQIGAVAHQMGTTPFVVVLAAFGLLLHRFSGQNELAIGLPVALREGPPSDASKMIGMFVNTLVLRLRVDPEGAFDGLVKQTQRDFLDAFSHRHVPFQEIVKAVQPERDASRTPLFQCLFSWQDGTAESLAGARFAIEPFTLAQAHARTDIALFAQRTRDQIGGYFEYSTALFDEATIDALANGLTAVLRHVAGHRESEIRRTPVMTDSPEAWAPAGFPMTIERNRTALHQFWEQASAHPDRAAVVFGDESSTYGELKTQVAAAAAQLREAGVEPGSGVALLLERTPSVLVAMLATWACGAYYIPLDPRHPTSRNARILTVATPTVIVADDSEAPLLKDAAATATTLVLDPSAPASSTDYSPMPTGDDLAYVIFTSGSTGEPKGVEIQHSALANFLSSMAKHPGLTADDSLLSVTTVSFDIAGLELFLPLTVGARICLADTETAASPRALMRQLREAEPTVMQATPATYIGLFEAGWSGDRRLTVLVGGEPLPHQLAQQLTACCGRVFNMYGPTETTIWSSVDEVRSDQPITIGRPIHNTQMVVLNEALQPQPPMVAGELYIGGDGLARGYHRRPDLTEERFISGPSFAVGEHASDQRLYRTGDLVRRRRDGRFEHLGRIDNQVKIRGYRIELGEIETALAQHASVERAVASVWSPRPDDQRLVAFYVRSAGATSVDEPALLAELEQKLPQYMVPSQLVELDQLPLTPNNKVDRKALPIPIAATSSTASSERPRDDVEVRLATIWEELLVTRTLGVHDDFFSLGGHSLLAVKLHARIESDFKTEFPLARIFEKPTIAGLADTIRSEGQYSRSSMIPLSPETGKTPIYLVLGIHLYRELAQELASDHDAYGIFVEDERRISPGNTSVEQLAEAYVQAVMDHGRDEPCVIGGLSMGGVVAFEAARRLTARGRKVEGIVLLDSILPGATRRTLRRSLAHYSQRLSDLAWVQGRVRQLAQKHALLKWVGSDTPDERAAANDDRMPGHVPGLGDVEAFIAAMRRYEQQPHTFDQRVLLIRGTENHFGPWQVDPEYGWRRRAPRTLIVEDAPGDHLGIVRAPNVKVTARIVKTHFARNRRRQCA